MGAWDTIYQRGTSGAPGTPVGYACQAIKRELIWLGFSDGVDPSTPMIGVAASHAIKAFQQSRVGLVVDGEVGPATARTLFLHRVDQAETKCAIPNELACKMLSLESEFDPGAVGVADPHDHGLAQINALAHPTVTLAEAFDPAFSISYLAETLQAAFLKLGDWDCAVAAWNVGGGGASDWCGMGKPTTGGPSWFPDLFSRATRYVALVREQRC